MSYGQQQVGLVSRVVKRLEEVGDKLDHLLAPAAIRPDGSGVGMNQAEATVENTQAVRELKAEIQGLRDDLKRRWEGG